MDDQLIQANANGIYENKILTILKNTEIFFGAFLYLILPFAVCNTIVNPLNNLWQIVANPENELRGTTWFTSLTTIRPIISFILFLLGSSFKTLGYFEHLHDNSPDRVNSPITVFTRICYFSASQLGLQFFLVVYEFYFYYWTNVCSMISKNVLKSLTTKELFHQTSVFIDLLENFQDAYGLFLLADLTIMLLYWLEDLFTSYFTFQTNLMAASGSVIIICAELHRVVSLSLACDTLTRSAWEVIRKLEKANVDIDDRRDSKVG
jgi:hypothetical protein